MDRRMVLGKSKAELVMARVGEVIGAGVFLVLLPILPVLLAYFVVDKFVGALTGGSTDRSEYEPSIGT